VQEEWAGASLESMLSKLLWPVLVWWLLFPSGAGHI